jgi:hypothetical protein
MPIDKPKHPDSFPAIFHTPLRGFTGEYFIDSGDERHCKSQARKYRCFLKSLEDYPLHPSRIKSREFSIKTKLIPGESGMYFLKVVVKGKFLFPG